MNLSQLRSLTRTYLNEDAGATQPFWSDATLNDLINVGVRKVYNLILSLSRYHYTKRVTFTTTPGVEYYNLPADLKDLRLVTRVGSDGTELPMNRLYLPYPFPWVEGHEIASTSDTAQATEASSYMVVGGTIRINPIPTSTYTIRLYYEARLTPLVADTDTPPFDDDYHDMAAKWAAVEARVKNAEKADDLIVLYKERHQDLVQDLLHHLPSPYTEVEGYLQGLPG